MEQKKNNIYTFGDIGQYLPKFIENRSGNWVLFGADNMWPALSVRLYNQSSMNRTCLMSKYDAVIGKGLSCKNHSDIQANPEETLNEVFEKCALDYLIHGGFSVNIVWNMIGTSADIYHTDFTKIRSGKPNRDTGRVYEYYFCSDWSQWRRLGTREICVLNKREARKQPNQLYYSKDYNPGTDIYPLSDWVGAVNDCLTDIQTSIFHNSNLQNGLIPSLWISMRNGIPDPQEQTDIYNRINDAFSGADKAGKFFLSFADSAESTPEVTPLRAENDQYYITLDQRVVNRILTAHRITSPLLLGIRDSGGGLGSNKDEILTSYSHFISTVVKPIQKFLLKEWTYILRETRGIEAELYIEPRNLFEDNEVETGEESTEDNIGGIKNPEPITPIETNEALRSLTGRQFQQLMRVVRNLAKEQITIQQAKTMLSAGYGLTEAQINSFLELNENEDEK